MSILVLSSRGPRTVEEIAACITLLKQSSFWSDSYGLKDEDILRAWENILKSGVGTIDIYENVFSNTFFKSDVNRYGFIGYFFVCYITLDFARQIAVRKDIEDINLYFLQTYIAHMKNPALPSPVAQIELSNYYRGKGKWITRKIGHDLYGYSFMICHPSLYSIMKMTPANISIGKNRMQKSTAQQIFGYRHNAWFNVVENELMLRHFERADYKLLRGYPEEMAGNHKKRYVLCITKNEGVADLLHIPHGVDTSINDDAYERSLFYEFERKTKLGYLEQYTACLLVHGYTPIKIAKVLYPDNANGLNNVYQNIQRIYNHLLIAEYISENDDRAPSDCVLAALDSGVAIHEIREFVFPLYPWPEKIIRR